MRARISILHLLMLEIFGHPSNDLSTLLNFRDGTPKRTDRGAIELLNDQTLLQ
jgi:hypothetical protein